MRETKDPVAHFPNPLSNSVKRRAGVIQGARPTHSRQLSSGAVTGQCWHAALGLACLGAGGGQYAYSLSGVEGPHLQDTFTGKTLTPDGQEGAEAAVGGGHSVVLVPLARGPLTSRGTGAVSLARVSASSSV